MKDTYIIVARIGRPIGVKGELRLESFTTPSDNLLSYKPLYLQKKETFEEILGYHIRPRGDEFLIRFDIYPSPEEARILTNHLVAIHRSQLPALKVGEFYWSDLQGLSVFNKENISLGKITEIQETGANPILFVVSEEKTRLIPYLKDSVILSIDIENQTMQVDWDADF